MPTPRASHPSKRMDESGLLDMLNYEGYETGEYVMDMYIDGELADSFRFTLE